MRCERVISNKAMHQLTVADIKFHGQIIDAKRSQTKPTNIPKFWDLDTVRLIYFLRSQNNRTVSYSGVEGYLNTMQNTLKTCWGWRVWGEKGLEKNYAKKGRSQTTEKGIVIRKFWYIARMGICKTWNSPYIYSTKGFFNIWDCWVFVRSIWMVN